MEKISELKRQLGVLSDKYAAAIDDPREFARLEGEIGDLQGRIQRAEAAQKLQMSLARPAGETRAGRAGAEEPEIFGIDIASIARMAGQLKFARRNGASGRVEFGDALSIARKGIGWSQDAQTHFRSLGEQLQAIQNYYVTRGSSVDARLKRAPTGAGEVDPTGGGFLVQTDFQTAIFMLAHDMGEILSRVNKIPISANSNSLEINAVDETSRATGSRWGGVQSYWVSEGDTVTKTKPKFRRVKFGLHKLFSIMYTTDELLQDSTALTSIAGQAFSEEVMFMTEDAIFEGAGNGLPLGFMNSPALVTVPKQNGQATQTIVKENIDNMWSRCWNRSRMNAVWLINQLCEPQLFELNQAVGTGGALVYMPPGGMSGAPYATLFGRPVIATEYSNYLGTPGDIALVDLSQYTLIDKGGVQAATSMHVAFLTDEMAFRITYRVDGQPMWATTLTPFKGGASNLPLSPFVVLATR